jgi:hypothetical protein
MRAANVGYFRPQVAITAETMAAIFVHTLAG